MRSFAVAPGPRYQPTEFDAHRGRRSVLIMPYRNPIETAKALATLGFVGSGTTVIRLDTAPQFCGLKHGIGQFFRA